MVERRQSGGILVVDDDSRLRESILMLLRDAGYSARGAANGREALDLAEDETPSLILLDLMMPVMDGWQFLAERAQHRAAREAAVVLLSGMAFIRDAPGVAAQANLISERAVELAHTDATVWDEALGAMRGAFRDNHVNPRVHLPRDSSS